MIFLIIVFFNGLSGQHSGIFLFDSDEGSGDVL